MGMTPGSNGMNFLKGGLTGLSQGLANYNNPHPVYDFSGLAKGFQDNRPPKVVDLSAVENFETRHRRRHADAEPSTRQRSKSAGNVGPAVPTASVQASSGF